MVDFKKLKAEVTADPLAKGYSTMTDAEVAASLNARDIPSDRATVPSMEVLAAIKPTHYPTDARLQSYLQVLLANDAIPLGDKNVRDALKAIFSGKTTTLTALAALQKRNVSRAEELGIGWVRVGFVSAVRG